jgi:uncharacterized membrane protein
MVLLFVALIPIIGIIMAITPYLMKKSECFTVTVPETAVNDPFLKRLKKRYLITMLVITGVLTALTLTLSITENFLLLTILFIAVILFIVIVGYGLMLYFRKKVQAYKKEQGWVTQRQEVVAVVQSKEAPRAISLKWNLLYLPIIILTLAIGYLGYASMPDSIPMQLGFDGQVATYTDKSPSIILVPVLSQAFLALVMFGAHFMITRSKRPSDPNAPETSALAYGLFAHAQSIYLLVLGIALCVLMTTFPLMFIGLISIMQMLILIIIGTLAAVVGGVAIAVVYGQGGSRVFANMQASSSIPMDEDRHWKLGIFYYNREDPSLFLLERFGVGWTLNLARPMIWVIVAGFVVFCIAFVVATVLLS